MTTAAEYRFQPGGDLIHARADLLGAEDQVPDGYVLHEPHGGKAASSMVGT